MLYRSSSFALALIAGLAFAAVNAAPPAFDLIGSETAFAKGKGSGKSGSRGGGSRSSSKSSSKGGSKSQSSKKSSASLNSGKPTSKPVKVKTAKPASAAVATVEAAEKEKKLPHSLVRQYVIANGLKQGDVASTLKSWVSAFNRNPRALLNNLENTDSLPGLQVAYFRENQNAQNLLGAFESLGGDSANPPTEADLQAAKDAMAAQDVLDAQALLAEEQAAPGTHDAATIAEATETVNAYTGLDPQTVVDDFATNYGGTTAEELSAQYDAWGDYQDAELVASDAFAAASVSYSDADAATLAEVRSLVDDIYASSDLGTVIPAAEAETAAAPQ